MSWATGYGADYSSIKFPISDQDGRPRHRRGVTDVPDLFFLELTWQYTRGSALIGWVKDDAEYIAGRVAEYQERLLRGFRVRHRSGPTAAREDTV